MEVHILYILYRFKNFKSDAGYHSEKLKKILKKKFYILDISQTWSVLKEHGYNVTPPGGSRVHHLD
jgi:hypothetical protein